jgi:hypothetical protein
MYSFDMQFKCDLRIQCKWWGTSIPVSYRHGLLDDFVNDRRDRGHGYSCIEHAAKRKVQTQGTIRSIDHPTAQMPIFLKRDAHMQMRVRGSSFAQCHDLTL